MSIDLPDDPNEEMARPHSTRLMMARLNLSDELNETPIDDDEVDRDAFGLRLAGPGKVSRQTGAVRLDKVAKVRAALSAGTYCVPAETVAVKMLDAMLALEQKRVLEDRRKRPRVGHRRLMRGRATRQI